MVNQKAVHTSILVAVLGGLFVAVLGELVAAPLLAFLQVPDNVFSEALLYLRIYLIGLPAGIQSAVFAISNIVIQSAINSLGTVVMAASSAAYNIEILAYGGVSDQPVHNGSADADCACGVSPCTAGTEVIYVIRPRRFLPGIPVLRPEIPALLWRNFSNRRKNIRCEWDFNSFTKLPNGAILTVTQRERIKQYGTTTGRMAD